jgi:hypothetical protein
MIEPSIFKAANAYGLEAMWAKSPPKGAPVPPKLGLPHARMRPIGNVVVVDDVVGVPVVVLLLSIVCVVVVVFEVLVVDVDVLVVVFVPCIRLPLVSTQQQQQSGHLMSWSEDAQFDSNKTAKRAPHARDRTEDTAPHPLCCTFCLI